MTTKQAHEYKGYSIELTPNREYCSAFAVDVRDGEGRVVSHLKAAGDTEEHAIARGREVVDFEQALQTEKGPSSVA